MFDTRSKYLSTTLLVTGFVLVVINVGFLALVTGPENVHSVIQLTLGFFGFILVLISMTLSEIQSGEKTVKEAIAFVAAKIVMLALFILIATLFGK